MKSNEITSTFSLYSYLQTSIKGNSRCNIPLTPTISCKYVISYYSSFKARTKWAHIPSIGSVKLQQSLLYSNKGDNSKDKLFHAPNDKLPWTMFCDHHTKVLGVFTIQKVTFPLLGANEFVLNLDIDIDDDSVRKYLNQLKFWNIKCFMTI